MLRQTMAGLSARPEDAMTDPADLQEVGTASLPCLVSVPQTGLRSQPGFRPLLCFVHGYDEGPPTPLRDGLTRHGPLASTASPTVRSEFIVVAPRLPMRGDRWGAVTDDVLKVVRSVQARHGGDPDRSYLTGFSFGGNGVFDLALAQPDAWAALWPVDPTRVPLEDPGRPVWLSLGEVCRRNRNAFIRRLSLDAPAPGATADRIFEDRGEDHVGTATRAYRDERIYRWLLSRKLPSSPSR